ncbi:MAG: hypothetical protein QHH14_11340 [Clostridiales bacterium]|jgi:hypothetical protein|nr:hypothetical protein [Clostridiales bacterium]
MIRRIFGVILAVILAVLVFYIAFAWTASCRLEREMVRAEVEAINGL